MQPQFWYFMVSGGLDTETGIVGNFYTYGRHCGEALAAALTAAEANNFLSPEASEAARLDNLEDFELPADLIWVNDNARMSPTTYSFAIDPAESNYIPPAGIIKSTEEGEQDYDLIQEAFIAIRNQETGRYEFELTANKSQLINTFIKAIGLLPNVDSLQINLQDHWENQETERWINPRLQHKVAIIEFLLEHQLDTLENGFVDCIINSEPGATKLILGEHKQIVLLTEDEGLFQQFGMAMLESGFAQVTELYSLEYGYYHWHYRLEGSLSRDELVTMLIGCGFKSIVG